MYYSLQAYRGIAALLVVLFHLGGTIASDKYFNIEYFSVPFSFGHYGVQLFFVLSGFLIFKIHKKDFSKPDRLSTYYRKRIIRIYPVFIIIFFLVYLVAYFSSLRDTLPLDIVTILKTILLLPQIQPPVITVAWTLQYEVLFYTIFSLFILNRYSVYFVVAIFIYVGLVYTNTSNNIYIDMLQNVNIYLFIFGMITAFMSDRYYSYVRLFMMGGGILTVFLIIDSWINHNLTDYKIILAGLASSLLVYAGVIKERSGFSFKKYKFIVLTGDASYSLYLLHTVVISALLKIFTMLGIIKLGIIGALFSFILILFFCIFVAIVFHKIIEKPLLKYLHKRLL